MLELPLLYRPKAKCPVVNSFLPAETRMVVTEKPLFSHSLGDGTSYRDRKQMTMMDSLLCFSLVLLLSSLNLSLISIGFLHEGYEEN